MKKKIYLFLRKIRPLIPYRIVPFSRVFAADNVGGSFKEYVFVENAVQRKKNLSKNLDQDSLHTIDVILQRNLNYPDDRYKVRTSITKKAIIGGLLPEEKISKKDLKKAQREYNRLGNGQRIPSDIAFFKHGIPYIPKDVRKYIKSGDFIDLGSWYGDSATVLMPYCDNKIFSVDISKKSLKMYEKTMKKNKIPMEKYCLIHAGITADKIPQTICIKEDIEVSASTNLYNRSNNIHANVVCKSLDTLVDEYNITPKFIKADIEGLCLDLVSGGIDALKKYRPVLSLGIYHNPKEFFEVKPFLEMHLDNYEYKICKLSAGISIAQESTIEVFLLAWPKEINNI